MIRLLYTLRIHQIYIILLFKKTYFKFIFNFQTPPIHREAFKTPPLLKFPHVNPNNSTIVNIIIYINRKSHFI